MRTLQMNMKYVMSASSVIILKKVYISILRSENRTNSKAFQVSQSSLPEHLVLFTDPLARAA